MFAGQNIDDAKEAPQVVHEIYLDTQAVIITEDRVVAFHRKDDAFCLGVFDVNNNQHLRDLEFKDQPLSVPDRLIQIVPSTDEKYFAVLYWCVNPNDRKIIDLRLVIKVFDCNTLQCINTRVSKQDEDYGLQTSCNVLFHGDKLIFYRLKNSFFKEWSLAALDCLKPGMNMTTVVKKVDLENPPLRLLYLDDQRILGVHSAQLTVYDIVKNKKTVSKKQELLPEHHEMRQVLLSKTHAFIYFEQPNDEEFSVRGITCLKLNPENHQYSRQSSFLLPDDECLIKMFSAKNQCLYLLVEKNKKFELKIVDPNNNFQLIAVMKSFDERPALLCSDSGRMIEVTTQAFSAHDPDFQKQIFLTHVSAALAGILSTPLHPVVASYAYDPRVFSKNAVVESKHNAATKAHNSPATLKK
jgi:hypothetical protein